MSHVEIRLVVTEFPDDGGKPIERYRIPVDPRCMWITLVPPVPLRGTITHVSDCNCGDLQALTGPPGKPHRRPMASPSAHDAFCDGTCVRGEPGPCPKTPQVRPPVDDRCCARSPLCEGGDGNAPETA